jgi:demethylmenaquinone methyltransferase/2-methoxy-6-polyprenyl-1,4-benzoquinol methylase
VSEALAPTPGTPEKRRVQAMFDAIAPRYDVLNRVLSARVDVSWRRAAVRALGLSPGARPGPRVLDLATGTGDLLLEAIRAGAASSVGGDLSFGMLRHAHPKLRSAHVVSARVAQLDAEALPLREEVFDGVTIAFGIRNVADRLQALREMRRVARPGARIVVLEFHEPRGPFGHAFRFYFSRILPRIGAALSGNASAYGYLPASVRRFMPPHEFADLMTRAGLKGVSSRPLTFGVAWLHVGTA